MDVQSIKSQFPVFKHRTSLVYVDNASTTQRPWQVIDAMANYERQGLANVHRGLYALAEQASLKYEETRKKTAAFIGVSNPESIVFTKGTTESINTIAFGLFRQELQEGDEIVISMMEHHANIIPWQILCKEKQAFLKVIPTDSDGNLLKDTIQKTINSKTKLIALTHVSNTLGTVNPIAEIISTAHQINIPVLIDAAQGMTHMPIDVEKLQADFLVFSAHKMFGPFGVGVLYVHPKYHLQLKPLSYGGGTVSNVSLEKTTWLEFPRNMEAGTPNVSGILGFSAALDFLQEIDFLSAHKHIKALEQQFREGLLKESGFSIIGNPSQSAGIISFVHENIHPHDIAGFLASKSIAVRAGHHCTQPLLDFLEIPATARVSFSIYNTMEDVEKILKALNELKKFWK